MEKERELVEDVTRKWRKERERERKTGEKKESERGGRERESKERERDHKERDHNIPAESTIKDGSVSPFSSTLSINL